MWRELYDRNGNLASHEMPESGDGRVLLLCSRCEPRSQATAPNCVTCLEFFSVTLQYLRRFVSLDSSPGDQEILGEGYTSPQTSGNGQSTDFRDEAAAASLQIVSQASGRRPEEVDQSLCLPTENPPDIYEGGETEAFVADGGVPPAFQSLDTEFLKTTLA